MQISTLLVPLLITLLIEAPVVAVSGRGEADAWKVGLLVNTLTNPIAVFLVLAIGLDVVWCRSMLVTVLIVGTIEVAVVIVEWRVYARVLGWSSRRAFVTSLIANGLSFVTGLLM